MKYYVIPILDSNIMIPFKNGEMIPISKYVEKYYPTLAKLESEKIAIIYSGNYNAPFTKNQINQLKNNILQKRQIAKELGIPLHILAVYDDSEIYEVATHSRISADSQVYIDFREEPRNIYLTYYNGDYINRVKKFMNRKNFVSIQGGIQKVVKR